MSIFWLDSSDAANRKLVGAKAATLAELRFRGFPVPSGFVLSVDALRAFLDHNHLLEDCSTLSHLTNIGALTERLAALQGRMENADWPNALRRSIVSAYDELAGPVAVRSSGVAEDAAASSFAGAYTSFLNRTTDADVISAVLRCWQ